MKRNELKQFVRTILLEKLEQPPLVRGKMMKKTLSFSGIARDVVCEGTIAEANQYAEENNLIFTQSGDSYFGGHYRNEMTSYEFHPNPEFYGELMETSMSAREQLARICGTNDQVLAEVDAKQVENLVDYIYTDESFREARSNMVFEQIESSTESKLYDKTQFTKLFEYLVNQSCTIYFEDQVELSESEHDYAVNLLSSRFFANRKNTEESVEEESCCATKSFTKGSAFENMQRISPGHQLYL